MTKRIQIRQAGISIASMAMILVIISLAIGALIQGSHLIERARVKQVVKKFDELQTASLTYLDRYNAIPGDDGSDHGGLITPATTNPNDGKIDNPDDYWQQIHDANLIPGEGTQPLLTPWNTPYLALYNAAGFGDNAICARLPLEIATEIDTRYDDGNGTTGGYRLAEDDNGQPATTSSDAQSLNDQAWLCAKDIQKSLVGR